MIPSKKAATAPPSVISNISNPSKVGKEKIGILTPSSSTAGSVPSHTNVLSNSQKLKGKVSSTENSRNPIDMSECLPAESDDEIAEQELDRHSIGSHCSDETEYTSMTEVKDRASTCTLVRNP